VARARNIKPGFFSNDELARCEYGARLLFVGLWTVADREGRLEDRPLRIKALLFPFDNCKIDKWLDQLASLNFITRYEAAGSKYIQVNNFKKHQHPHVKEPESTIPAPGAHQSGPADCGLRIPDTGFPHTENGSTGQTRSADEAACAAEAAKVREVIDAWNQTPGVRTVRGVTGKRLAALRARLAEADWDWRAALAKFPLRCFASDPSGYVPTLDWFVRPQTVGNILEGNYDWTKNRSGVADVIDSIGDEDQE
jgi:hypothetical protein